MNRLNSFPYKRFVSLVLWCYIQNNVPHYQILSYVDFIIILFMSELVFITKLSCFLHNLNHIFKLNKLIENKPTRWQMTIRFLKQFTNIVSNKGNSMIILFGFNTSRYRRRYREYGKVFYEAKMFHMSKYMMCIRKLVKFKTGKKLGKK